MASEVTSIQVESLVEIVVLTCPEQDEVTLESLNTAGITDIQQMTLAEYNALSEKVPTVRYLICN